MIDEDTKLFAGIVGVVIFFSMLIALVVSAVLNFPKVCAAVFVLWLVGDLVYTASKTK